MPALDPIAREHAQRIINDSYPVIMRRPANAWKAYDPNAGLFGNGACQYDHRFNDGCAFGCLLPSDFDFAALGTLDVACLLKDVGEECVKFREALNIPDEVAKDADFRHFCREYQQCHDESKDQSEFSEVTFRICRSYGVTVPTA